MDDLIACPTCRKQLLLPPSAHGQQVRCPQCSATFEAQSPQAIAITAEPPKPVATGSRQDAPSAWSDLAHGEPDPHHVLPTTLPGEWNTLAAVVLLGIAVGNDLVQIASGTMKLERLESLARNPAAPSPVDDLFPVLDCLPAVVLLPTVIVFCTWMHRSYKNLIELGVRGLRHTPGWAVGYFFIPILSLYRPCQVTQEMWRASGPTPKDDPLAWRDSSGSVVAGLWWTFWILAGVVNQVSFRAGAAPGEIQFAIQSGLVADVLGSLAGVFAIATILAIRKRQQAKLDTLRSS